MGGGGGGGGLSSPEINLDSRLLSLLLPFATASFALLKYQQPAAGTTAATISISRSLPLFYRSDLLHTN